MLKRLFILIVRLVLAAAFVLAALPKIQDPVAFAAAIEGYRVIEGPLVLWVALLLPWLELFIGIGLLVPFLRRSSGLVISALLILFIGLHVLSWARGLDINCGCYGSSEATTAANYPLLLARNAGLLAACLILLSRDLGDREPA
jgi:uncharacterized membrane protein YphA (DoxX/SURF4 family)